MESCWRIPVFFIIQIDVVLVGFSSLERPHPRIAEGTREKEAESKARRVRVKETMGAIVKPLTVVGDWWTGGSTFQLQDDA